MQSLVCGFTVGRGILLLNIAVRADGSIPSDQFEVMEEFGAWLKGNREAIYDTQPWKKYGEGGTTAGGHFNERGVNSEPWDHHVLRFTCNKAQTALYVHTFGNPAGKEIVVNSLSANSGLFSGKIKKVSLIGSNASVQWSMKNDGLHINMPVKLPFKDCNVLKINVLP